jgi:hypothetical protein
MSCEIARAVVVLDLPLAAGTVILKPEQVILRFGLSTVDVGALCFLKREQSLKTGVRRAYQGRNVQLDSVCTFRKSRIEAFISFISNEAANGKRRDTTLYGAVRKFTQFLDWADLNGHSTVLNDIATARIAAVSYAQYVKERVMRNEVTQNYGARSQTDAFTLIGEFFEVEDFHRGINVLSRSAKSIEATRPPCELEHGRFLALCESLFFSLSDLVLEEKPYPFAADVPPHLGYADNKMWVFPSRVWCMPKAKLSSYAGAVYSSAFDYLNGAVLDEEGLIVREGGIVDISRSKKQTARMLARASELLRLANSSPHHPHRIFMATLAHNAFLPLFLSRTALTWSELVDLPWSGDDLENTKVLRQKFRAIKYRAKGKRNHYELPLKFMNEFKIFLKLRKFLLRGYPDFPNLFLTLGLNASFPPEPLKTSLAITCRAFQRIDPDLAPVLSRASRAAMSNWIIPNADVSTAAILLQNSEQSIRKSYAAGSYSTHLNEMSSFYDGVVSVIPAESSEILTPVGTCNSFGNPNVSRTIKPEVTPNCDTPEEGCLFCDKFKIHADETDVRKLLSCQYCLTRASHLAGLYPVADRLIKRIEVILDEVHCLDGTLVNRIREEVAEGEMDPYWSKKYDMLVRLRLIHDDE